MGSGEVGGGGSVHWDIQFDDAGNAGFKTIDQKKKKKDDVGKLKGHSGYFKVRLKLANVTERDQTYESITKLGDDMIVLFVRASDSKRDQIRIDW